MKTLISILILFGSIGIMYLFLITVSGAADSKKRLPIEVMEHPDIRKQIFLEIIQNKEYMIEFNKTWEECQCLALK